MNDGHKFIGFDLGAESGRCIVAVLKDQKIILHEVHRFTTHNYHSDSGFHWDISKIQNEIIEGLKKAKQEFGSQFDGISVDTWGVDYVFIDKNGDVLSEPFHYRDDRTDLMMEEAFKIVPKEKLYGQTGIQFAQYNTLFQLLAEKRSGNDLLNAADKMLLMPDFLNYTLSGIAKSEFSIASTTSLADPIKRNWNWELIDEFGFPKHIFTDIVEPGTILGPVTKSIAESAGLDENIPVIACAGHDTGSAVASVPASNDEWAFLSSGTWSLMGVEVKHPQLDSSAMERNFTNEGGIDRTTRLLKNIIGLWPIQECRRFWAEQGKEYSYVELNAMAEKEGRVGAWVDLNDPRFLKPGEMPDKIISYLKETGQTVKTDIGYVVAVVLESLAFAYKKTLVEIEKVTGKKISILHAVGGGIQNEILAQYTADAIGRKVYAGPVEGTIVGNIGVQAMAAGIVNSKEEWRQMVASSFPLKIYEPVNAKYFEENEEKFNNILMKNN